MTNEERDALDARLIAAGEHSRLLAAYYPVIVARLRVRRIPEGAALDIAHDAVVRLLEELERGKRYRVPFRVVVHQVTKYCALDHFVGERDRRDQPWDPTSPAWEAYASGVDGELDRVVEYGWFHARLDGLTPHDRRIAEMFFVQDMEIVTIAETIGMQRNAVDQALHRVRRHIRGQADDD